jgi:Cytochrome P460
MFNVRTVVLTLLVTALQGQAATAGDTPAIPSRMTLPADFPVGFQIYETVVSREDKIVFQRYANRAALQAARAGQPQPDGSVIVVAQHSLLLDEQGQPHAGPVQSYAAMASRAGWGAAVPAPLRNGNWDFASFNARGQRNDRLDQTPCLACHQPLAAQSHVFTLKTLREHAQRVASP